MRRVLVIGVCGLSLSACTSSDLFRYETAPTPVLLRVESEPPGAEAKLPSGQGCKTPCELPLTAAGTTAITFALDGYVPASVEAQLVRPADPTEASHAVPNPLQVQLDKAPPPKKKRRAHRAAPKKPAKPAAKKPVAARSAPAAAAPSAAASAPTRAPAEAPAAPPPPAEQSQSPWPPAPGQQQTPAQH